MSAMTQQSIEAMLEDEQANLRHHEEQVARARAQRDAEVTKAHIEAGVSMYRIAQVLGISQQAVGQIVRANS